MKLAQVNFLQKLDEILHLLPAFLLTAGMDRNEENLPVREKTAVTALNRMDHFVDFTAVSIFDSEEYLLQRNLLFKFYDHRNASFFIYYTQFIRHSQSFDYGRLTMVIEMISYEPFYETLFRKNITEYNLIYKQGFSANTLYRIKQGKHISTKTLDALCDALGCKVEDIIRFEKE